MLLEPFHENECTATISGAPVARKEEGGQMKYED